jgi:hypothetical protein
MVGEDRIAEGYSGQRRVIPTRSLRHAPKSRPGSAAAAFLSPVPASIFYDLVEIEVSIANHN